MHKQQTNILFHIRESKIWIYGGYIAIGIMLFILLSEIVEFKQGEIIVLSLLGPVVAIAFTTFIGLGISSFIKSRSKKR